MTGHTVSPRAFSAAICSTCTRTRFSMTANTSSTGRPAAVMRARSAALTCRMAPGRSSGVVSQCGRSVRAGVTIAMSAPLKRTPYQDDATPLARIWARVLSKLVAVTAVKPSLELLRELSDEHVLRALMAETRLTRAELAARTGISKPTVGESVRRLDAAGIVVDTGARSSGRGRAGSYYALADGIGRAFAVSIAPAGEPLRRPARPDTVIASVRSACRRVSESATGPVRLAVVSAADPVDRV